MTTSAYRNTFLLLLGLLVLTVAAAFVDLSRYLPGHLWNLAIALTIALAKTTLILLYFMHLRGATNTTRIFAIAGFLWLAILLTLTLADYTTRNHPRDLNFKGEPRYLQPR